MGLFDARLREIAVNTGGFALFLAWVYSSFYSGSLLGYYRSTLSLPEYFWSSAALGLGLMAVLMAARRRRVAPLRLRTISVAAGAMLMCAGDVAIWLAFAEFGESAALYRGGGFVAGCGEALVLLAWLRSFARMPKGSVSVSLTAAFVLAFVFYLALLPLPNPVSLAAVFLLPFATAAAALQGMRAAGEAEEAATVDKAFSPGWREAASYARSSARPLLLLLLLSLNCAFLRYIASPWYLATEPWFYATVFASAIGTALLIIGWAAVRRPFRRYWDLRAAALVLCASYLVLYVDFSNVVNGTVSYAVNLVCTAGLQLFLWSHLVERVREAGRLSVGVFLSGAAFAFGIFAGVAIGDVACNLSGGSIPVFVPLLFLCVLFAFVMFVPFGLEGHEGPGGAKTVPEAHAVDANAVRAELLASRCGLSDREAEVLALLLSGRSRPFISETLFISLGTVNSHVSSIYRKTGVHSLQQLISLAEAPPPAARLADKAD